MNEDMYDKGVTKEWKCLGRLTITMCTLALLSTIFYVMLLYRFEAKTLFISIH